MNDAFIEVDGINLNATHFGSMKESDAIKKMLKEGIEIPGETEKEKEEWAKKAYSLFGPEKK